MKIKFKNIIFKLISLCAVIYGFVVMTKEPIKMTYFTMLANLFIGITNAIFIYIEMKAIRNISPKFHIMRLLATVFIIITFIVYNVILAPTYERGYLASLAEDTYGSLAFHIISPVFAIIDFFVVNYDYEYKPRDAFYAVLPPLIYEIYIVILSLCGVTWKPGAVEMSAPYNFLNFKAPCGWFGFDLGNVSESTLGIGVFYVVLVFIIVFLVLARALIFIKNKLR